MQAKLFQIVKPRVVWIVVADARRAMVYSPRAAKRRIPLPGNGLQIHYDERNILEFAPVLPQPLEAESAAEYNIGRKSTGRVFESSSAARHMAEPHMYVQDEIRMHFAKTIADMLNASQQQKSFDQLILVALPKILGELEPLLSEPVQKSIMTRVQKDLTHLNQQALNDHLKKLI